MKGYRGECFGVTKLLCTLTVVVIIQIYTCVKFTELYHMKNGKAMYKFKQTSKYWVVAKNKINVLQYTLIIAIK